MHLKRSPDDLYDELLRPFDTLLEAMVLSRVFYVYLCTYVVDQMSLQKHISKPINRECGVY